MVGMGHKAIMERLDTSKDKGVKLIVGEPNLYNIFRLKKEANDKGLGFICFDCLTSSFIISEQRKRNVILYTRYCNASLNTENGLNISEGFNDGSELSNIVDTIKGSNIVAMLEREKDIVRLKAKEKEVLNKFNRYKLNSLKDGYKVESIVELNNGFTGMPLGIIVSNSTGRFYIEKEKLMDIIKIRYKELEGRIDVDILKQIAPIRGLADINMLDLYLEDNLVKVLKGKTGADKAKQIGSKLVLDIIGNLDIE